MISRTQVEDQLDELERRVLQTARRSKSPEMLSEGATLDAVRRRIAALPITGLPNIEIPQIPNAHPTTLISGASGKAAAAAAKGAAATQALPSIPMTAWFTVGQLKLAAAAVTLVGSVLVGPLLIPSEQTAQESTSQPTIPAKNREARTASSSPPPHEALLEEDRRRPYGAQLPPTTTASVSALNDLEHSALARSNSSNNSPVLAPTPAPMTPPNPLTNAPATRVDAQSPARSSNDSTFSSTLPHETREELGEASPERPQARTLTGELERLRTAQQALQNGDPALALQTMLDLDRQVSGGALYPERQIIKVLALCALGRRAEAQSLAVRLGESSGGAVYTSRLRNSCVSSLTTVDQ